MSQGPLCPNLTQKVQKEVSQIANHNLSCVILLGGLSVNLNHLKRDSTTLIPIIIDKVKNESTIISDCWKSYNVLTELDFKHLTVNHKYNFVDPETLAHTQNIENLWWQIRRQLPETYTKHEQLYL